MKTRSAILFILITIVIDSMGIGIILPVMPDLILELEGGSLGQAALWGGVLTTLFAVMQFLFGPILGNLSDWFGRRPILLTSLFVISVDYLLMAVAGTIWLLLLARVIAGIASATHATASAFMADVSKPEEKAQNFGLIGAAFGVGFVLGPLLGGLLGEYGPRVPFYAAALLAGANLVLGYFALPETVNDKIRRPFTWVRANPFGSFASVSRLPGLRGLLFVSFLNTIAVYVYPVVWAYFTKEAFGWEPGIIGLSLATYGVCTAIAQGWLIRPIIARLGEFNTVIFGFIIDVLAFVALSIVWSGWVVFALLPFTSLGAVAGPALQGMMSRAVSDDSQGELQGVLTSVNSVAMVLSPPVMAGAFFAFTKDDAFAYVPGAPFVLSAFIVLFAIGIFVRAGRRHQRR
ncbi:MAG: TCR/Tet family MFS transporter [Hyphomicrobiales bacterium]